MEQTHVIVIPVYLQRQLEKEAKTDLEWFFADWVYRDRGLPDFRITAVHPRRTLQGNFIVSVTVENTGSAAALVPVRLLTATGGEFMSMLRVPGNGSATIRIDMPLAPSEAIVNDGSVPESDSTNNRFTVPR